MNFEIIPYNGKTLAILARPREMNENLNFFSPENFALQVAVHNKPAGTQIEAHEHIPFENIKLLESQEIFYLENGKIEVGLYHGRTKIRCVVMMPGDMIILNCGHDLKFLENSKMIEVKQGPYRGKENEKRSIK
jgi:hypothetical protein